MRKFRTVAAVMAATAMIVTSYGQVPVQARKTTVTRKKTGRRAGVKLSGIPKAAETNKSYALKASAKNVKKVKYRFTYKFKGKTKTIRSWSKKKTVKFKASRSGTYKFTVSVRGSKGAKASATLSRKFSAAKTSAENAKTSVKAPTASTKHEKSTPEQESENTKTSFTLSPASLSMKERQNASVRATGWQISDGRLSWKSSDPSVASVHSSGKSSASVVSMKAGTAIITATSADGTEATCTVTVKALESTASAPSVPVYPAETQPSQETPVQPSHEENTSESQENPNKSEQTNTPSETPSAPSDHKKTAADYSYKLKEIYPTGKKLEHYSNPSAYGAIMIFAKTDYQENDVVLVDEDGNIKENGNGVPGIFKDIEYTGWSKGDPSKGINPVNSLTCNTVKGGLLFTFLEKKAGTHTYHLEDDKGNKLLNSNTITITVKDGETEEKRQIDKIIVTALNSTTPAEYQHSTAQEWIDDPIDTANNKTYYVAQWMRRTDRDHGGFDYVSQGDGGCPVTSQLLTGTWWQSREIDCGSASGIMKDVAIRLGVPEENIHEEHEGQHVYLTISGYDHDIDGCPASWPVFFTHDASKKDDPEYHYYDMLDLENM